jgi:VCBS repeat-containing protein
MPRVSLSTSTNFPGNPNALVEDQNSELTFTFTLDEPAPAGGLKVYVDSNVEAIMNRLDLQALGFDSSRFNNLSIDPAGFLDFIGTGFAITINAGATTASIRIPIFDNVEGDQDVLPTTFEGFDPVTFTLKTRDQIDTTTQTSPFNPETGNTGNDLAAVEGNNIPVSSYTIGTASSTVQFADTASQLPAPVLPRFKITATTPTTLIEQELTSVTLRIELVEGTLPPGGLAGVRIGTGVARSLGQFDVLPPPPQASFTGLSNLVGLGDNSGFTFRMLDSVATLTLPLFNDDDLSPGETGFNINEDTGVINLNFALLPSTAATPTYAIDAANNSVALTLADTRGQVEVINGNYSEATNGDPSNNRLFPTQIALQNGDNVLQTRIESPTGRTDRDYIRFTVPEGFQLKSIVLDAYDATLGTVDGGSSFMAVQRGDTFTENANTSNPANLLGYTLFGTGAGEGGGGAPGAVSAEVGDDLLDDLGATTGAGGGSKGTQGFTGPLGAGNYTFWIQNLDGVTATTLRFVVEPVSAPNSAPVADDDSYSTAFNTALTVNAANGVLNGDTDADGDALTAAIAAQATNGVVQLNADGSFTYTPNAGFSGNDTFSYTVSDGRGGSDTAIVTVAVAGAVNTPPVGVNDTNTTDEDTPVNGNVLTNDTDADNDTLTVSAVNGVAANVGTAVTLASGALVTVNADGTYTYNPNGQFETLNTGESATDSFQYTVSDGKGGSSTATTNLTINGVTDTVVTEPVVSFSITPATISEAEGTQMVMNFTVDGTIPEGGIVVKLQGSAAELLRQFASLQTRFNATDGSLAYTLRVPAANVIGGELARDTINVDPSSSGFLSDFTFKITSNTASIAIPVLDDLLQEADQPLSYTLVDGEGYSVNPAASTANFTVTDGVVGGGGPTVRIAATPGTLYEQEPSVVTFTLVASGLATNPIPPEGLVVFVEGPPRAVAEFDVNGTNNTNPRPGNPLPPGPIVTGGAIVGINETAGGFFVRIDPPTTAGATSTTTTIQVPVFKDPETEAPEGDETLTFNLRDGELYNLSTTASQNSATVTINDTLAPPVVTMTGGPAIVEEGNALRLDFAVSGTIPPTGVRVSFESTDPLLFEQVSNFSSSVEGRSGGILPRSTSTQTIRDEAGNVVKRIFSATITEPTAFLTLPALQDNIQEPDANFSFKLIDGQGYNIDAAAANMVNFTVTDGAVIPNQPVVSITATPNTLYESEGTEVTLTFNVDGVIPEGGLNVFVDSGVRAAIGEFAINGNARNGVVTGGLVTTGGTITGTDSDVSGFFFRIDQNGATATVAAFQDNEAEGIETFTYRLVDGETYDVSASQGATDITIADTRPGGDSTRDVIIGTDSSESLIGLGGRDTITTGGGNDLIVYTSVRDGVDTITDFIVGSDKFDLRQIMRGQGLTLSYADTVAQGYLKFGSSGGNGVVQFDLDGNAGPNRAISLAVVTGRSVADLNQEQNFLLV